VLRFEGIRAGYGTSLALQDVTLAFGPGLHVVLGPNGAGKTTLLRVGAGVLAPRSGRVLVGDRDVHVVPEAKGEVAYLPHRHGLHPGLTVRENLLFWARILLLTDPHQRIEQALEGLRLRQLAHRRVGTLSRGEAQRVATARALMQDAKVLLLDEPTTGMDPASARGLRQLLRKLARSDRVLVVSTHNLYEAAELAEDVVLLASGRVVGRGSVPELLAQFGGRRRVLVRVVGDPRPTFRRMGVRWASASGRWLVDLERDEDVGRLVRALVEEGLDVREVAQVGGALEAVYFGLVNDG